MSTMTPIYCIKTLHNPSIDSADSTNPCHIHTTLKPDPGPSSPPAHHPASLFLLPSSSNREHSKISIKIYTSVDWYHSKLCHVL